nr:Gfo/Idh/MocA family oxidoreductase [Microbacterium sp. CFH 90308]
MRIGVLGAAKIAHRSSVPALLATPGIEVAGVAARDFARAREFADVHGIAAYADYRSVIDDDDVDAVYIPLPVGLHAEWALAALQSGKHVLCEKSLAGSYDEVRDIVAAARADHLVVVENFMCERHPQNEFVRAQIADGAVGPIRHAALSFGFPPFPADDLRNSRALAGGALNDAGAYCVDMAAFYLGRWPTAVTASLADADYEVDVIGSALLEYTAGLTAAVSFGFLHDYRNEARIWGDSGQIEIQRAFSIPADRRPDVTITRNTVADRIDLPPADQFALQMGYFRDLVASGNGAAELERRLRHAAVMEAVRRSAAQHRRVTLDELADWTPPEVSR